MNIRRWVFHKSFCCSSISCNSDEKELEKAIIKKWKLLFLVERGDSDFSISQQTIFNSFIVFCKKKKKKKNYASHEIEIETFYHHFTVRPGFNVDWIWSFDFDSNYFRWPQLDLPRLPFQPKFYLFSTGRYHFNFNFKFNQNWNEAF